MRSLLATPQRLVRSDGGLSRGPCGLGLVALALGLAGVGDPAVASAEPAPAVAGALSVLPRLRAVPHVLVLLGLAGLLVFSDRISRGSRLRRDR